MIVRRGPEFVDQIDQLALHDAARNNRHIGGDLIGLHLFIRHLGTDIIVAHVDIGAGGERALDHGELLLHLGIEQRLGQRILRILCTHDQRPSAVICWADEAAIDFQSAILNAGLAIPGDLSLISFDGLTASRYMSPPICTFDQNMTDLGARAAQLLIDMIDSGEPPKGALIEYPAKLFSGGSIAPI